MKLISLEADYYIFLLLHVYDSPETRIVVFLMPSLVLFCGGCHVSAAALNTQTLSLNAALHGFASFMATVGAN